MNKVYRKMLQIMLYICICCLGITLLLGCAWYQFPESSSPSKQGPGSPPNLSNLSASPNPTHAGNIVNLTTSYLDPDGDLQFGVAAISVDGGKLSRIAFQSTYVSGVLTIPVPVSYYNRSSHVQISLRIRDSAGNWSNTVSTVLSIR